MSILARRLSSNAALKAIALCIAVALFLFVRKDHARETVVELPVSSRLPSDRVLVSEPVSQLRVTVSGSWTRISQLVPRALDPPLQIDLSRVASGTYRFVPDLIK